MAVVLLVLIGWRFASRRASLPCPSWLASLVELENPLAREHQSTVIISHLNLQPGMNVLDVGCGPGRLTIPLARSVGPNGEVVALDVQAGMIQRAREYAHRSNVTNIRFLHAEADQGSLEQNRFDRALLVTVLGEIPDRESALREIFQSLKPGGILSITEIIFDPHFQRRATLIPLATAAGFREGKFFGGRFVFTIHFEKPS